MLAAVDWYFRGWLSHFHRHGVDLRAVAVLCDFVADQSLGRTDAGAEIRFQMGRTV